MPSANHTTRPKKEIQERERNFLMRTQRLAMTGLHVLRRLVFLGGKYGKNVSTSLDDLAAHTARSVPTLKRYLSRMEADGMLKIHHRRRGEGGTWLTNTYQLTAYGRLVYEQLSAEVPTICIVPVTERLSKAEWDALKTRPRLKVEPQISKAIKRKENCSSEASYGEILTRQYGGRSYEFVNRAGGNKTGLDKAIEDAVTATLSSRKDYVTY